MVKVWKVSFRLDAYWFIKAKTIEKAIIEGRKVAKENGYCKSAVEDIRGVELIADTIN